MSGISGEQIQCSLATGGDYIEASRLSPATTVPSAVLSSTLLYVANKNRLAIYDSDLLGAGANKVFQEYLANLEGRALSLQKCRDCDAMIEMTETGTCDECMKRVPLWDSRSAPKIAVGENYKGGLSKKSRYFVPSNSDAEEQKRDWNLQKQALYVKQKHARWKSMQDANGQLK